MGRLSGRVARLEAAAFDAAVRRLAVKHRLSAEETARLAADTRRIAARVGRLRAAGLSEREAVVRFAVEDGLDPEGAWAAWERAAVRRGASR